MARRTWYNTPSTVSPLSASLINDLEARKPEVEFMARNVKDYGALTDGITDATAAIQAAITATGWPAVRGAIYLPPGQYRVDGTITLNGGGLVSTPQFEMYGPGVELYTELASANPILSITNSIVSVTRVHVRGIQFRPNVARTAVVLNNAEICSFTGCDFGSGPSATAFEFTGVSTGNRLIDCSFYTIARGILFTGAATWTVIQGCVFHEGLSGSPLNWIEASNGASPTSGVTVSGCLFVGTGATLPLLRVQNGEGWRITGNVFFESPTDAIYLYINSKGHVVSHNTFTNGHQHDINVNGAERCSIMGNVFDVRGSGVANNTYANVRIQDTFGASDRGRFNVITGNVSRDTAAALSNVVAADATALSNVITGNIGLADFVAAGAGNVLANNLVA